MDAHCFDTLTRSLTATRSRRGTLTALLGGTLGLLGLADTAATKGKGNGKGKKKKKTGGSSPPPASTDPTILKEVGESCLGRRVGKSCQSGNCGCTPTTCTCRVDENNCTNYGGPCTNDSVCCNGPCGWFNGLGTCRNPQCGQPGAQCNSLDRVECCQGDCVTGTGKGYLGECI
jgi:hypothetical protein